jgi:hypothetical protein
VRQRRFSTDETDSTDEPGANFEVGGQIVKRSTILGLGLCGFALIVIVVAVFVSSTLVDPNGGVITYSIFKGQEVMDTARDMIYEFWGGASESIISFDGGTRVAATFKAADGKGQPVIFALQNRLWTLRGRGQITVAEGSEYSVEEITTELARRLGVKKYPPLRPRENEPSREQG